jgi:hypothetical protein
MRTKKTDTHSIEYRFLEAISYCWVGNPSPGYSAGNLHPGFTFFRETGKHQENHFR